jgi:hypothetical protein
LGLLGIALASCGEAGDAEPVGVTRGAITSETARIRALLEAGSDGDHGFVLKRAGGPLLENFNETLPYDPASSIKIVVGVSLLRRIDAGASFNLNTSVPHFFELSGSCPTGGGASESRTLGSLLQAMLVVSDNAATRTLIDFLGGFEAINATAQSIGMTSTNMVVYPGCHILNTITQSDAARLYEGLANGTLLSSSSRAALFARMPSDGGDSTGTLSAARAIADAEGASAGVPASLVDEFENQIALHYKAGNDLWCDPYCRSFYSISGLAEIPTCSGSTRTKTHYAFGLFIANGTDEFATANTFFNTHPEVLRRPIREALATWEDCSVPPGTNGAPCTQNGECHSFVCQGGLCRPPQCAPTCNRGAPCGSNDDCGSDVCSASGTCAAPLCSPRCSTGQVCGDNGDCSSFVCRNNLCAPSFCAPRCNTGSPCGSNADCISRRCSNGICAR